MFYTWKCKMTENYQTTPTMIKIRLPNVVDTTPIQQLQLKDNMKYLGIKLI